MKRKIAAILAAVMCMALLAACSGGKKDTAETKDTSLEYIQGRKKMIMGFDDNFPPMGFKENGEYVGFDIDLAKAVAKKLDVELVLQPIVWSTKELELNGKNIDVIWNGLSKNPEREENMTLSAPYMQNEQSIMVLKDSSIKTLADLKDKKVAIQDGSSAQSALKKAFADKQDVYDSIKQITFSENISAIEDLKIKKSDAVAIDSVVARYIMSKNNNGNIVLLDEILGKEDFVVGFRKGDKAFRDEVDKAIEELKKDGTFAEISIKWFGKDISANGDKQETTTAKAGESTTAAAATVAAAQ